jgi:hypothetical protein
MKHEALRGQYYKSSLQTLRPDRDPSSRVLQWCTGADRSAISQSSSPTLQYPNLPIPVTRRVTVVNRCSSKQIRQKQDPRGKYLAHKNRPFKLRLRGGSPQHKIGRSINLRDRAALNLAFSPIAVLTPLGYTLTNPISRCSA